jgi:Family of unknown function (DUF6459)
MKVSAASASEPALLATRNRTKLSVLPAPPAEASTRLSLLPAPDADASTKLSVRPIPDLSPPVIDSRTALLDYETFQDPRPFVQGTLAIDFTVRYDSAQDPEGREYFGPQRALSRDLPEPKAWVKHIAQALVEVMSGARPAPQVIRWTTPEVYSVVARRNATSGRRKAVARRALVRRVRICEPVDGVVEACAVVVDNGRVRALAMRLTGVDRRWVVTELQVG